MANSKGASTIGSMTYHGKNSLLPPKIPFPSISPSYTEYIPSSAIAPKSLPKPRDGNSHHQRTSSESFLIEEQPSWLDDLLNEPDTPVRKGGHRRSSSDSFAYNDTNKIASMNYAAQDDNNKFKNISPSLSWGSQDFNIYSDMHHSAFYADPNPCGKNKNKPWVTPPTLSAEKKDVESGQQDPKGCFGKKEPFHLRSSASETDTKRAKQQFAQRSRVRKLQYIAELERNVYALQALEQDVLEREAGRLRSLYQQQNMQQPQQQQISSSVHRRAKSRDFDQQFANLSLKHKETNPSHDSFSSHI
ncbi:hypothetical protein MIMGU_mgv1a010777mg [Erythranthe guttata]|uniref:BZIP domain-containing protein n=1 Tax=Erythranthe guttata TaxID=4155 RepID=A0A022QG94_ERYGU|nr:hypothetical protein MIMGU_mgv1a010777mg [Erythranthe guttata]